MHIYENFMEINASFFFYCLISEWFLRKVYGHHQQICATMVGQCLLWNAGRILSARAKLLRSNRKCWNVRELKKRSEVKYIPIKYYTSNGEMDINFLFVLQICFYCDNHGLLNINENLDISCLYLGCFVG